MHFSGASPDICLRQALSRWRYVITFKSQRAMLGAGVLRWSNGGLQGPAVSFDRGFQGLGRATWSRRPVVGEGVGYAACA